MVAIMPDKDLKKLEMNIEDSEEKSNENAQMKILNKDYLQCGYEDRCKHKDCLKCPRRSKKLINFSLAEMICIEDFAICDLQEMINRNQTDLMQKIMLKLMKKVYKDER